MYFTTMQRAMCNILPDLVLHIFTFICSPLNNVISLFHFIKLCIYDFSRITFAAKLSTNLVYNSIFVIDYELACLHLVISCVFADWISI